MIILSNAFSLQMINCDVNISITTITEGEVNEILKNGFTSAICHSDTANVVSSMLGIEVASNRINVTINRGDILIVAQVIGVRLHEGCTTLPEGIKLVFKKVEII